MKYLKRFENQKFITLEEFMDTNTYWYYKNYNQTKEMKKGSIIHCIEKLGFGNFDIDVYYFNTGSIKTIHTSEDILTNILSIVNDLRAELRLATKEEIEEFEMAQTANKYNL